MEHQSQALPASRTHWVQVEDFELSVKLECELRPYQREGIAWLAFLRRTGLHGCLADDMGLGKTLQATAIIAGLNKSCIAATGPHMILHAYQASICVGNQVVVWPADIR